MGIGSLDVIPIIYGRGGGADGCWGRRGTGSCCQGSSGFILFGLGGKMGSFGIFAFGDWLGVYWGPARGCSSALRYSTGRRWSLKCELREVVGGEGVRFLGVGGNGGAARVGSLGVLNGFGEAGRDTPQSGDCHQFPPLELAGCTRFALRETLRLAVSPQSR
jgi:hypothetical protein